MKKILLFLGLFLSMTTVFAEDNVLQTIEIVPVKDTYNIVFTADKAVDVKKTVKASNQINLNLKDIRVSKNLNTVYNNVSNVDTVMVEPAGNGINIFFQAENAQGTSVSFDSIAPILPTKQTTQKLQLSHPIESYSPIYKEDLEQPKTSALFNRLKNKTNSYNLKDNLDVNSTSETLNTIFSFGIISLLIFATVRLFRRKESNIKIGLGQNLTEREVNLYSNQPIGLTNTRLEKPISTINYGINAYQKEARNPYEPANINANIGTNFSSNNFNTNVGLTTQPQNIQKATSYQASAKPIQKSMTTPVNNAPVNQSNPNINNLKFLESMTAIYEKSGRYDLARGLKANLAKNNIL